jgi:ABC-type Zn uptake system ZnuABC Zn-binding protein ZnuA
VQYYKPWELRPEDEERIKSQITAAEAQVRQEEEDFASRYPYIPRKKSFVTDSTNFASIETVGKPRTESPSVSKAEDTTNDTPVQVTQEQETSEKQSLEEQNGEVVVENEEDTVIY